jgi:hypothetical protein
MTPLSSHQKQLLFDYCIGLTSENETAEAGQLISSGEEAAEIYSKLKTAFAPLDCIESEYCPDDLAESTILRLNNQARASQLRLSQLLAGEQSRQTVAGKVFWLNLGRRLATAAVFVIVGSTLIAATNFARQKYWQYQCQTQLARIFEGVNQYSSDHDGKLPAVATAAGSPWWKIGYPGQENYSNTRHLWLLVKGDYVKPADFVCPGTKHSRVITFNPEDAQNYNDFPDRKYITFSLRIKCNKPTDENLLGRKVLIADLNPLFEKLPNSYSEPFKLQLNKDLLSLNSINHNRHGQNALFCDGSVRFLKTRRIDVSKDDIFTLRDTNIYQGTEVPTCEADAFLAP